MKLYFIILLVGFMAFSGCNNNDQDSKPALPTRGKLVIGVDESLRPVVDAEIRTFSLYYPNTDITPLYLPEKQVVEKLLANEIQTGLICRELNDDEIKLINNRYNHTAISIKLADDAIVSIVNNSNRANNLSYDVLKKILSGEITNWGQIDPTLRDKSSIKVVMTTASSMDRYFSTNKESFSPIKSYALYTTIEVIDYVRSEVSALGIVGGSWFYQKGNKYSDVKLLRLIQDNSQGDTRKRELFREVYAITHEPLVGPGNGFISFMTAEKGQLILSKAGMTPYKPIVREIKLMNSSQLQKP